MSDADRIAALEARVTALEGGRQYTTLAFCLHDHASAPGRFNAAGAAGCVSGGLSEVSQ